MMTPADMIRVASSGSIEMTQTKIPTLIQIWVPGTTDVVQVRAWLKRFDMSRNPIPYSFDGMALRYTPGTASYELTAIEGSWKFANVDGRRVPVET